jgi:RNA polymerase sigma-70 factor (ECF subfamily)
MRDWNDAELLAKTHKGDAAAFAVLYDRHRDPVYRYALRMTGSVDAAEEVLQEAFLALIEGARGYDGEAGPLRSYLYGVARNLLSRRYRAQVFEPVAEGDDLPALAVDPLEGMAREEQVAALRSALISLPLSYREVVVLCDLEELPYAEAAEVLGVPAGTVRSRLNRARRLLLDKLSRAGVRI